VSAPSKKSLSSASLPISACSDGAAVPLCELAFKVKF
jgi:hypothetical protein